MPTEPAGAWVTAYLGLGSNLQNPRAQIDRAFAELAKLPESRLVARSACYGSTPLGPSDQPAFVNAAARLETRLAPGDLLAALQDLERRHGRRRQERRWGPRVLDLDILMYGQIRLAGPRLRLPHPELANRAFVLVPLADIAPGDLYIPGQGRLAERRARCPRDGVWRL